MRLVFLDIVCSLRQRRRPKKAESQWHTGALPIFIYIAIGYNFIFILCKNRISSREKLSATISLKFGMVIANGRFSGGRHQKLSDLLGRFGAIRRQSRKIEKKVEMRSGAGSSALKLGSIALKFILNKATPLSKVLQSSDCS